MRVSYADFAEPFGMGQTGIQHKQRQTPVDHIWTPPVAFRSCADVDDFVLRGKGEWGDSGATRVLDPYDADQLHAGLSPQEKIILGMRSY